MTLQTGSLPILLGPMRSAPINFQNGRSCLPAKWVLLSCLTTTPQELPDLFWRRALPHRMSRLSRVRWTFLLSVGFGVLEQVDQDDPVLIDGSNGVVVLRPGEDILDSFEDSGASAEKRSWPLALRTSAETVDGARVTLLMNAACSPMWIVWRRPEPKVSGFSGRRSFHAALYWLSVEDQAQIMVGC